MAAPKMKSLRMLGMRVKGMQNTAIIRSLTASDSRKVLVTVRMRLLTVSTTMMRRFPITLRKKMSEYSRIRSVWSPSTTGGEKNLFYIIINMIMLSS